MALEMSKKPWAVEVSKKVWRRVTSEPVTVESRVRVTNGDQEAYVDVVRCAQGNLHLGRVAYLIDTVFDNCGVVVEETIEIIDASVVFDFDEVIYVSRFHHQQEVEQIACRGGKDAARKIRIGNANAADGWSWRLTPSQFVHDDGTEFTCDEINVVRRKCGLREI